jgi:uncharacterized protein YcfJ
MPKTAVFCLARDDSQATHIVEDLKSAGFSSNDISVLMADKRSTRDFANEKQTKAPEGATTGAVSGGVIGGVLGWLTGIGALAIPGLGPFIAAGPIMAALSGVAVGGAAGGIVGALIGMGIPEYEAKRYESMVKEGRVLVSVHSDNAEETRRAKAIFERNNADGIASSGEAHVSESDRARRTSPTQDYTDTHSSSREVRTRTNPSSNSVTDDPDISPEGTRVRESDLKTKL